MDNPNTNRVIQRDVNCLVRHLPQIVLPNINIPKTWEFLQLTKREKALILQKFFQIVKKFDGGVYPNKTLKLIADNPIDLHN